MANAAQLVSPPVVCNITCAAPGLTGVTTPSEPAPVPTPPPPPPSQNGNNGKGNGNSIENYNGDEIVRVMVRISTLGRFFMAAVRMTLISE